jgi:hypothetical protein
MIAAALRSIATRLEAATGARLERARLAVAERLALAGRLALAARFELAVLATLRALAVWLLGAFAWGTVLAAWLERTVAARLERAATFAWAKRLCFAARCISFAFGSRLVATTLSTLLVAALATGLEAGSLSARLEWTSLTLAAITELSSRAVGGSIFAGPGRLVASRFEPFVARFETALAARRTFLGDIVAVEPALPGGLCAERRAAFPSLRLAAPTGWRLAAKGALASEAGLSTFRTGACASARSLSSGRQLASARRFLRIVVHRALPFAARCSSNVSAKRGEMSLCLGSDRISWV